jgi:hypothetical protein
MGKKPNENQKTFTDLTQKSWFTDGQKIKIGENLTNILSGKVQIIEVKEILDGDLSKTWKIVVDKEDKIYLLKTVRELK